MDSKEKYDYREECLKSSIAKACFKVRVNGVLFLVPFGSIESFIKMALAGSNNFWVLSSENSDLCISKSDNSELF